MNNEERATNLLSRLRSGSVSEDEARTLSESRWWESHSDSEAALIQLRQPVFCMPYDTFSSLLESALGRGFWNLELSKPELLIKEIEAKSDFDRIPENFKNL